MQVMWLINGISSSLVINAAAQWPVLSRVNSDAQMVMVIDRMAPLDELPGAGVDVGMLVAIYQNFELNERIRTFQIFMC